MKIIKRRGPAAWTQRRGTLHGSTAERRLAKWSGQIIRRSEKPKGRHR